MVRTRFAPSPTGYLHIGGVRTALFNWLFARRHGGRFLLRIDDTDQQRNLDEALPPILDGFRWLGIDWDEGPEVGGPHAPYFQSRRGARYETAVAELLARGAAYRDYARAEELQVEREAAERSGGAFVYSRRWMAETDEQAARFEADGRSCVVRLRMPRSGQCAFQDLIRGDVAFDWAKEQDHVVRRPDGTFLYHLASVVDDHDFAISHVIRAVEHLSNTPRQIFIAQALGYELPVYAHLPYVAEPGSQSKLSKRKIDKYLKNADFQKLYDHARSIAEKTGHAATPESFNPVLIEFYRAVGFLPDAIVNYLLLLGWSLDDKTEDFTRDEMIRAFDLARVTKSPASFDPAKLMAFQERYMRRVPIDSKAESMLDFVIRAGWLSGVDRDAELAKVRRIARAAGERIRVAGDVLQYDEFFVADDRLEYDEPAFEKRVSTGESKAWLKVFRGVLESVDPFEAPVVERALHAHLEETGRKIGQVIHALRIALTGKPVGFGMFDAMEILGRASCLARIDRAVARGHGEEVS
ncbi:MAG: glutamate--tRNA ligase [Planctomycetes bacterium]|nr:glutamate--tRNA ligase [Planctomycetota bacterium]